MLLVRLRRTEDNDARIFGRRVGAQIREIKIERQERAPFRPACVDHPLVWGAAQGFVIDCLAVVASLLQETRSIDREILVDLATHRYAAVPSGRKRHDPLLCQLGRISERCLHRLGPEARIRSQQFLTGNPRC